MLRCTLKLVLLTAVLLFVTTGPVISEKILFLLPVASPSFKNVQEPLFKAMADRGHEVTLVSPGYLPKPHKNIREIVPTTYAEIFENPSEGKQGFENPFKRRKVGVIRKFLLTMSMDHVTRACHKVYENEQFMALLDESFDLVVLNGFFNICLHGFIYKLGSPFMVVTPAPVPNVVSYAAGNYLPPSFVPFLLSDLSHDMNFLERVKNLLFEQAFNIMISPTISQCEAVYKKHLGEDLPDSETLEKNVSMILSNSFFPLTYPRPLLPDVVEVGGMHCRPAGPLDQDLEEFLAGAPDGFIYFSLGSIVNTDLMPEEIRLKFLNVFSRLKQRVIWKWNSGQMEGLPDNVRVSKWFPQQDVLGHQNIRVFMTHGGLLSTLEAVYHGVPLIGLPLVLDQDLNILQAVNKGYALKLEIINFTEEILEQRLNEILYKSDYSVQVKKLSSVFKDQPQTPLERAVFWTEYVMRHKGAHHMRSAARNLNYFQYHSLDVIAFIGSVIFVIIFTSIASCTFCLKKIFRRKTQAGKRKLKKKRH